MKIGESFSFNGESYDVVEGTGSCVGCSFGSTSCRDVCEEVGWCVAEDRPDGKDVQYIKREKHQPITIYAVVLKEIWDDHPDCVNVGVLKSYNSKESAIAFIEEKAKEESKAEIHVDDDGEKFLCYKNITGNYSYLTICEAELED